MAVMAMMIRVTTDSSSIEKPPSLDALRQFVAFLRSISNLTLATLKAGFGELRIGFKASREPARKALKSL
jgi:hypothetical protein